MQSSCLRGGLDAVEVADALLDRYSGRRPSSIAAVLEGRPATSTPDPATHFWVSVAVHMQRRLATRLHETIQDGLEGNIASPVRDQTVLNGLVKTSGQTTLDGDRDPEVGRCIRR